MNGKKSTLGLVFLILQVGLSMMVSIAVGGVLGYYIGRWLGLDFILVIGLFFGAASGYSAVYNLVKKYLKTEEENGPCEPTPEELKRQKAEAEFQKWKKEKEAGK